MATKKVRWNKTTVSAKIIEIDDYISRADATGYAKALLHLSAYFGAMPMDEAAYLSLMMGALTTNERLIRLSNAQSVLSNVEDLLGGTYDLAELELTYTLQGSLAIPESIRLTALHTNGGWVMMD